METSYFRRFVLWFLIITVLVITSCFKYKTGHYRMNKEENMLNGLSNFEIIQIKDNGSTPLCEKVLITNASEMTFIMCLNKYLDIVASDIEIIVKNGKNEYRPSNLQDLNKLTYTGKVNFELNSFAVGHFNHGAFDGYFVLGTKYFYLEHVTANVSEGNLETDKSYTCALYRDDDKKRKVHFDNIGARDLDRNMKKWKTHVRQSNSMFSQSIQNKSDLKEQLNGVREKRSVSSMSCRLHLVADHTFFEHVGQKSVSQTVSEIVSRVGEADVIFRGTDFSANGYGDNVGFQIVRITVFSNKNATGYKLGDETLDVYEYLDRFSEYNFDDVCLGTAFSYRDFEGGTLGLAWVASSSIFGPPGGICQKQIRQGKDYKYYSLNTAIVTLLNYGRRLLSYEVGLVLTHEYGHNFGSPHDPKESLTCSPNNEDGNFIMYPYASSGSKPNHEKFSPCSINSMYPVILNKGSVCLVTHSGPRCGNFIVEEGEECDCGSAKTCAWIDPCCSPPGGSGVDPPCKFKRSSGFMCSPLTSPCCSSSCSFIQEDENRVCSGSSECKIKAICNGTTAQCPENVNKPDNTLCEGGRQICKSGICSKSICVKHNLDQCQCSDVPEHECLVCCKHRNSSTCVPASIFGIFLFDIQGRNIRIKPGQKCNSKSGFCNKYGNCISKDNLDVMKHVFSEETANEIHEWFENHWYYVLVAIATVTFLVIVFIITKKKTVNVQVDAFRLGRLENFVKSAEHVISQQEESLQEKEDYMDRLILSIQRGQRAKATYIQALGRLTTLFPTAPQKVLSDTVRKASDENAAVLLLISQGYPLLKLVKE